MVLQLAEQDDFFDNYLPLLFYAGVYEGILPEAATFKDFIRTDLKLKAACRHVLFTDPDVIKLYKEDNRKFLGKDSKLAFVNNVQKGLHGKFIFLLENNMHSIFQYAETNIFYAVTAITEPITKMIVSYPAIITTAIFNFKGKIVCDGIIAYKEMLVPTAAGSLMENYRAALENNTLRKKV